MAKKRKKETKYIFVVGGVMSGIGKGITASSIAKIIQARGYSVTAMKIDPYVNVDAGTMNPVEHGEVFVLQDGLETDQDLGNYERFLETNLSAINYITTGSIYLSVIKKERNLEYAGKCVSVVPEIPMAVIDQMDLAAEKNNAEFVVVEVGGTLGEYQNILFLEAYRILKVRNPQNALFVVVSYLPLQKDGELKSKPTQQAVRLANAAGILPDIVVARSGVPIDKTRKEKIAFNCSMREKDVISAPDVESIYEVPINFEKDGLGDTLMEKFGLGKRRASMEKWKKFAQKVRTNKKSVKIGIVGKYFSAGAFTLADSYISVIEAVRQSAFNQGYKAQIDWLNATEYEKDKKKLKELNKYDGIIVPGGFGSRAVEGKIRAIQYCRENKIPFLGLCYGMQLAVVEFARNVVGLEGAHTTEIDKKTSYPVIDIMDEQKENLKNKNYGATMRLGNYPATLKEGTLVKRLYGKSRVVERHRHRYEVNPEYIKRLEARGLVFSGSSPDRALMEFLELNQKKHPFFVATQAHPEFLSRPLSPHPLFMGLIKAASERSRKNQKINYK
ncbi:MAG: CTP synthase [Candidatus Harrisonbacteria bacterium CG10_big_fil_rev_8_21_14_0_10_44_23]|uniref:CTP synthase n=1 Tax=Candidatus Harrisonbacteria bacterium CG10_big_fil_rev_8_21_14_0_10_44_23 TaxID=1974585 RepID=A0A2H0US19_9BACT|nr:MAG: CTP synthase [Candidatus Harrisonbacteria bacterium CG10_big_fil_rev_8_21_14_0_10_44_23]